MRSEYRSEKAITNVMACNRAGCLVTPQATGLAPRFRSRPFFEAQAAARSVTRATATRISVPRTHGMEKCMRNAASFQAANIHSIVPNARTKEIACAVQALRMQCIPRITARLDTSTMLPERKKCAPRRSRPRLMKSQPRIRPKVNVGLWIPCGVSGMTFIKKAPLIILSPKDLFPYIS